MVYNEIHRRPFVIFQKGVSALSIDPDDPDARLRTARRLLDDTLSDDVCIPLRTDLAGYDQLAERDFESFVDALIHPRETSYSPQSLRAFVAEADLRFSGWRYPAFWDPAVFLKDPAQRARGRELSAEEQEMLIFHVGGYGAPYLDVVVERSDAPLRSPAPVRDLKPLLSQGSERQVVEGAALGRSRRRKPFRLQKDQIVVTLEREGYVHPRRWSLPRGALPLLEAMRGERTVAELAEDFAELVDEDDLVELVKQLLPEHMGLAVPAP